MLADIREISGYEPGDAPFVFWRPWLGSHYHLGPDQMDHMLMIAYVQAWEAVSG